MGTATDQKMAAALRIMCYAAAAGQLVEVLGMYESLSMECLPRYSDAVVESLDGMYVREPKAELAKVEARFAELGFPGAWAVLTALRGSGAYVRWGGQGCSRTNSFTYRP
jgi:hypothetical protein